MGVIQKQTIDEFLCDLGDSKPTPGGGAVAAVTGAMASALVAMVARLTKKDPEVMKLALIADDYKGRFLALADDDVVAFDLVMTAYRTHEENQVQAALKKATEVPLATYLLAKKVESLATEMVTKGNKNAISDAKSAVYLSQASQKSALENVEINLANITDKEFVASIRLQI